MLERLRQATASLHERLDSSLDLQPKTITRDKYADFLRAIGSVVPGLEQRLAELPDWRGSVPQAPRRLRAALITSDLQAIGAEPPQLKAAPALPEIATLGQALGATYVLEGSTLGGAVLSRGLGPALGLTATHGLSYWNAYGGDLRTMWTEFVEALEHWSTSAAESEREAAISTAIETFETFLRASHRAPGEIVAAHSP
jgi:heme oxygenase